MIKKNILLDVHNDEKKILLKLIKWQKMVFFPKLPLLFFLFDFTLKFNSTLLQTLQTNRLGPWPIKARRQESRAADD